MAKLKCIFCGKLTFEKKTNVEKKIAGRIIIIKNALVNSCSTCNEIFYSNELTDVINYALQNMSNRPIILYEDALYEYKKYQKLTNVKGNIAEQFRSIAKNNTDKKSEEFILDKIFNGNYYINCMRTLDEKLPINAIKKDSIVFVYHYTNIKPLKAIIAEKDDEGFSLRFSKELAIMNFIEGDPFVLGLSVNGVGYNIGAVVKEIDKQSEIMKFNIVELYHYRAERRSERIPVSIYCEACKLNEKTKFIGIVKDLSSHGLLICMKEIFIEGTPIEVYLHTSLKIIRLIGSIIRAKTCEYNNEYGVDIVKIEKNDLLILKKYITYLGE